MTSIAAASFCSYCGAPHKGPANFCPSCGREIRRDSPSPQLPSASHLKHGMSRTARAGYAALVILLFGLFFLTFARHLPGGRNPVIEAQPEVGAGSVKPDEVLRPEQISAEIRDGKIVIPLAAVLEKRMVGFEYRAGGVTIPLIAFITGDGKLVTAVAICEPCNSHSFTIEGSELACGNCETRWKLNNLEGIQGACQQYPPAPVASAIVGRNVEIDELVLKNWKLRI